MWDITYTVKGKLHKVGCSYPGCYTAEDYITAIKKEFPNATDITAKDGIHNGGRPKALPQLKALIKKHRPDITDEVLTEYEDFLLPDERNEYMENGFILSPPEAKKFFASETDYDDFVYIRPLGIVVFNITGHTSHEIFLSRWRNIIKHIIQGNGTFEDVDRDDFTDKGELCGEEFLHSGCGFFMSSAYGSHEIQTSSDHRMTFAEKQVFKGMRVRELDPE